MSGKPESIRTKKNTRIILLSIAGTLFLILLIQNSQNVALHFLLWRIRMPMILFIPITLAVGFAAGYFAHRWRR